MRSVIAAVSFLAAAVVADQGACLTNLQAQTVAEHFQTSIAAYTDAVPVAYFSEDFHDYSDSVSTLINGGCVDGPAVLGEATFESRAAFQAGQGHQPNITFSILNVWNNCDTVFLRWKSPEPNPDVPGNPFSGQGPTPQEQVTGIVILETTPNTNSTGVPFLIKTVLSEFNSGAWLVDLGQFKPSCNGTAANGTAHAKRDALPVIM